jgi:hypothetical protein
MTSKPTPHRYFWIVLLAFLAACGQQTVNTPTASMPAFTASPTPISQTALPIETPQPPYVYTVVSGDTCESVANTFKVSIESIIDINNLPSSCPLSAGQWLAIPYSSASPVRPSPTPRTSPTPLSKFSLDGYVMTFIKNGDLYFQDGENLPVKLTHVGEKSYYASLSDDNQKVVFYRSDGNEYAINADGTQEQIIIPNNWLASFESGTKKSIFGFIPHTHQLLLETYLCESEKYGSPCSARLFIVDTDTYGIAKLADLDVALYRDTINRNIKVSPNGEMIAVGTMDGMDIFTLDGKIIRENILPYKPSTDILFPYLFWLPDSSGLTLALPDKIYDSTAYDNGTAYTIWRYLIDDNSAVQMPIDPSRITAQFDIFPDGKWIIYGGVGDAEPTLYLGDLTTGHVQVFDNDLYDFLPFFLGDQTASILFMGLF